ncbi:ferritin-like domain-containing protein [Streptomyces sp. NPDC057002]|uniref:ferritin-like domain-containing protein n=1 Tax=Streptomyces sp. NPDC057002 TaxID=3345992 RepID=UPI00362C9A0F
MNNPVPGSVDLPVPKGKVFPRNLTARADYAVPGNPSGSRPESGVDNCFPGLEFDQRNLEKAFFPGLLFDFHHGGGSRLIGVTEGAPSVLDLTAADLGAGVETDPWRLHLWAVCGRTTVDQTESQAPVFNATSRSGLALWRRVHDLLPGRIAILLGPTPGIRSPGANIVPGGLNARRMNNDTTVQRDDDGRVEAAVLIADRADYLDADGVIDPDVYLPGDLTRSLCAPWQYDFRECGCYYWAASKPDISASPDGRFHPLNFQRSDRTLPPPKLDTPNIAERGADELDHPALITDWNVLPVVLNGREDDALGPGTPFDLDEMTREKVIEELERLASVEHALCLEYLYAHYSIDAPTTLAPGTNPQSPVAQFHAAAAEVFSVAVDEMRHLRWVNEVLGVLGRPHQLDPPPLGMIIQRQTGQRFELKRLTADQLDWFIRVESISDEMNPDGIDGMYVRLHHTIVQRPDLFPQSDRLAHLIKLIIDEGVNHFERFKAVKGHLAEFLEDEYLRGLDKTPDAMDQQLLQLADLNYAVLLGAMKETLALGDRAGGVLIEHARRAMTNLHEVNHLLASRDVAPRFQIPQPDAVPALADGQATLAAARAARHLQETIRSLDGSDLRVMMTRHQAATEALIADLIL